MENQETVTILYTYHDNLEEYEDNLISIELLGIYQDRETAIRERAKALRENGIPSTSYDSSIDFGNILIELNQLKSDQEELMLTTNGWIQKPVRVIIKKGIDDDYGDFVQITNYINWQTYKIENIYGDLINDYDGKYLIRYSIKTVKYNEPISEYLT